MFTEVLKIVPQVSGSDLSKLESSLGTRFKNIAKGFGKGLIGAIAGGGLASAALGLVDKFLNPLKETQEAIDKTLAKANDVNTFATQFNTTTGKLAKLQAFGQAKGLEPDTLNFLIEKFQTAVALAKQDPNKSTAVRQFVGDKDTAEAFFTFIQQLKKMSTNDQLLVQQEVFGERAVLKMSEFLNADFGEISEKFFKNTPSENTLTKNIDNASNLNDLKQGLDAARNLNSLNTESGELTKRMIMAMEKSAQLADDREAARIKSFESFSAIADATTKITGLIESGLATLSDLLVKVTNLSNVVNKIPGSRFFRGLFGGDDK